MKEKAATGEKAGLSSLGRPLILFATSRLAVGLAAVVGESTLALFQGDAARYLAISRNGYVEPRDFVYLPAQPLAIKALTWLTHNPYAAAIIASHIFFFIALTFVYRLGCSLVGEEAAFTATALCAFFPTSYLYSTGSSDALLLATLAGAYYYARQDRWPLAGLLGFIAALTRVTGCVVLLPLAVEYFIQKPGQWRDVAWLLVIPLGLTMFLVYASQHDGHPLAVLAGHGFLQGFREIQGTFAQALRIDIFPGNMEAVLQTVTIVFMGVLTVGGLKMLPGAQRVHLVAFAACLVFLASTASAGEAALLLFPAFYVLGKWLPSRPGLAAVMGVSASLLGILTMLFMRG